MHPWQDNPHRHRRISPEYAFAINRKFVALGQDEGNRENRHQPVLHAERRFAPYIEQLGNSNGPARIPLHMLERLLPDRAETEAIVVAFCRGREPPALAVAKMKAGRFQDRRKQPSFRREAFDTEAL